MKILITLLLTVNLFFLGCVSKQETHYSARFYLESKEQKEGPWASTVKMPVSNLKFNIIPNPILTEADIEAVSYNYLKYGNSIVFKLNQKSIELLKKLNHHIDGERLIFIFNGHPVGFRDLNVDFINNEIVMFLEISDKDIELLVSKINEKLKRI